MGTAKLSLAGVATLGMLVSTAFAEDNITGTVTKIDRLNTTIAIQQTQTGTVGGSSSGGVVREFKVKDANLLEDVHAGDRVNFSTAESNGSQAITKLKKQ
jgi:Cu/Ag efflux protein CusF